MVSGVEAELLQLAERLEGEGIRTKRLVVSHAFHSALMEPILDALEKLAGEVSFVAPRIALVSNLSGREVRDEVVSTGYWRRHAREARFPHPPTAQSRASERGSPSRRRTWPSRLQDR